MRKVAVDLFVRENQKDSIGRMFTPKCLKGINREIVKIYYDFNYNECVGRARILYKKGRGCGLVAWVVSKRQISKLVEIEDGKFDYRLVDTDKDFKMDGLSFCLKFTAINEKEYEPGKYIYHKIKAKSIGLCQGRNLDTGIEPLKGLDKAVN